MPSRPDYHLSRISVAGREIDLIESWPMKAFSLPLVLIVCFPLLPACAPEPAVNLPPASRGSGSNSAIVEYCRLNKGRKVGDGECWTLANEAFKAVGKKRPGGDMRVWGREVNYRSEGVREGDIVEFQRAIFTDGDTRYMTGAHHTAVVVEGGTERITVAEQNFMGMRKVSFRYMFLKAPRSGKMRIYRP